MDTASEVTLFLFHIFNEFLHYYRPTRWVNNEATVQL